MEEVHFDHLIRSAGYFHYALTSEVVTTLKALEKLSTAGWIKQT